MMAALHQDMRRVNRAANEAQGYRLRPILFDARIKPSLDMAGSRHVAALVKNSLMASPKFQADLAAVREEIGQLAR
jgi:hypothetical protein